MMKSKMVERINNTFSKIKALDSELSAYFKSPDAKIERFKKIELGSKVIELQGLNKEFMSQMDLFFDLELGSTDDFSQEVNVYHHSITELSKPYEEINSEELKKIKEIINKHNSTQQNEEIQTQTE